MLKYAHTAFTTTDTNKFTWEEFGMTDIIIIGGGPAGVSGRPHSQKQRKKRQNNFQQRGAEQSVEIEVCRELSGLSKCKR